MKDGNRIRGGREETDSFSKPKKEPVPAQIEELVAQTCGVRGITVAAKTNLNADGDFCESWVVLTPGHLLVCEPDNDGWRITIDIELASLDKLETVVRGGVGVLEYVGKDGRRRRLSAYPESRGGQFGEIVARAIAEMKNEVADADRPDRGNAKADEDDGHSKRRAFQRMFRFSAPYKKQLTLIFLYLSLGTCAGLLTPYMSKLFLDYILKPDAVTHVYSFAKYLPLAVLAYLAAHGLQLLFSSLQARCAGYVGHRTVYEIRAALYEKLQELSLSFFDKHQTGAVIARVNQDTGELRRLLVDFLPLSLESLFTLVGVGALLFVLNWRMTFFVLLPISSVVVAMRYMMPRLHSSFHRFFKRRSQLSAVVNDSVSGMRVVKAFGQGQEEMSKFDRFSSAYRDAGIGLEFRWAIYHPIMHFLIILGTVIVWYAGGLAVISGEMTVGSLVAYLGYLAMFYRPVFMLTRMFQMIVTAFSASERIFDILDAKPEVCDSPDAVSMPQLQGRIEFRNVSFGYNSYKPILKEMSFTIEANEVIGLVGRSGAGKSTMINLIARLYDANKGEVLVDGINVKDIRHDDLRKHIGVVLQETFLFSGSIYENIAYARPDASRKEVIEAAEAANAHDFILRKSDGYDTEVGERGNRLSGGEKQRIAIARAILRNPRILILDEATSAVDTETEEKIQRALEKLTRNRTTIAIAHRLSTLRHCDRLFVIDDGRLAEIGTHRELVEKGGVFAELVDTQSKMSQIIAVNG